ncbi:MAG: ISAs1 family transposase [Caldilineaceae bacterium SB0664_bin_22]|nr:ISAs1 family transposase [Caldilineaceae bacterium SB0664_bin_22]
MAPGLAASLRSCLEEVSDPRSAHARRHPLTSVLFLALTAVIGGADTWVEVEEFGRDHRAWFERWLHLPHGIPSHDTFSHDTFGRVFALLDPEPQEAGFARWVQTLHDQLTGQVVALDGKTARRSHDRSHDRSALHTVSAYAGESRWVLAQTVVAA